MFVGSFDQHVRVTSNDVLSLFCGINEPINHFHLVVVLLSQVDLINVKVSSRIKHDIQIFSLFVKFDYLSEAVEVVKLETKRVYM